jgi:hypothetical protein
MTKDNEVLINFFKEKGIKVRILNMKEKNQSLSWNQLENTKINDVNNNNNNNNNNNINFPKTIKELGFEGEQDFYHCIAKIDLSDSDKREKFELWKKNDGTKNELLKIQ